MREEVERRGRVTFAQVSFLFRPEQVATASETVAWWQSREQVHSHRGCKLSRSHVTLRAALALSVAHAEDDDFVSKVAQAWTEVTNPVAATIEAPQVPIVERTVVQHVDEVVQTVEAPQVPLPSWALEKEALSAKPCT